MRIKLFCKNDDSGFDLFVPVDYTFKLNETKLIDFKISCEMLSTTADMNSPYYLYSRSSIYKYDLIMMNNVGIIDPSYTGNLYIALIRISENVGELELPFCKCQMILRKSLYPVMKQVYDIKDTARGNGCFGSTSN